MTAESRLCWTPLKRELDRLKWTYTRIENKVEPGTPDVNIHIPGKSDIWVEMKYAPVMPSSPKETIDLGLEREQYIWLWEANRAGRKCCMIIRVDAKWLLLMQCSAWQWAKAPHCWGDFLLLGTIHKSPAEVLQFLYNI